MSTTHPLIAAALAAPKTHRVTVTYDSGRVHTFDTRSLATAENYAVLPRRNIGRPLIERDTGAEVRVVDVSISII